MHNAVWQLPVQSALYALSSVFKWKWNVMRHGISHESEMLAFEMVLVSCKPR